MIMAWLFIVYFSVWATVTLITRKPMQRKPERSYSEIKSSYEVQLGFLDITRALAVCILIAEIIKWIQPFTMVFAPCDTEFRAGVALIFTAGFCLGTVSLFSLLRAAGNSAVSGLYIRETALIKLNLSIVAMFTPLLSLPFTC